MNKISHSKFRNTGAIFNLIVRQISADVMSGQDSPAVNIIKEYFTNSELAKEYKLYNIILTHRNLNESKANMLIETVLNSHKKLNKTLLRKQRYNLIKEIKNYYNIDDFFKAKINNYKIYAAVCVLFESSNSNDFIHPEILVKNKVSLLEHITRETAKEDVKDKLMEEYLASDKGTRFLTYKLLIEKFNQKYSNFNQVQKEIIREYINNISNTNNLKEFINLKFIDIKKDLKQQLKKIDDRTTLIKLNEVINLIKPIEKNEKVKDDDVLNLLNYSSLLEETKISLK